MNGSLTKLVLAAFGLCALASMTNVACSSPTDVDSGTSEIVGHPYGGYGGYGDTTGYSTYGGTYGGVGVDLATDATP
ncbi:MAG: hypothetical protein U0270_24945 [Labilithrix sp.]